MLPAPLDMYALDALLTDEERLIRDTVRRWVDQRCMPDIEKHYREGTFPARELFPEMGELGLLGPSLSGYGCPGLSNVSYGLMMAELERCDSGLRSAASVQGSLVMYPIFQYGSDAQKEEWLPQLAAGTKIGCFGLTEPNHGSDPGSMETRARKVDGGYVLNGAKMWITNGTVADCAIVWARVDDVGDKIRGFLVDCTTKGFSAPLMKGKWSLRASITSELVMEDCFVPDSALLPHSPVGLRGPLSCLTQARYGIAWGGIGAALACFESARRYSLERSQFGTPIGGFQLTQRKLANMAVEITKAQLLAWRLGRLKDEGKMTPIQVSVAKLNNIDMAVDCARVSREIHGAMGISDEYPIMRHMMNLESVKTYEGTNDIHTLAIGRALTGLNAFA